MSRRLPLPQSRRHVLIFDEDWNFLNTWFGDSSTVKTGVGPAIRAIVHQRVEYLKAKQAARLDELEKEKIL